MTYYGLRLELQERTLAKFTPPRAMFTPPQDGRVSSAAARAALASLGLLDTASVAPGAAPDSLGLLDTASVAPGTAPDSLGLLDTASVAPGTAPVTMRRIAPDRRPLSPLPDPKSLLGAGRSLSDPLQLSHAAAGVARYDAEGAQDGASLQLSHAAAGVARDDANGAQDGAIGGAGVSFATLLHLVQRKFDALGQPHLLFGAISGVSSGVSSAGGVLSATEQNAERVGCAAGSRPSSLGMRRTTGTTDDL